MMDDTDPGLTTPDKAFVDGIAQAISDPGSIVGRKFDPSWGEGNDGYAEQEETVTRWSTRAVLAVLDAARSTDPGPAPTLYRRAAMGKHLLWVHECGHVEAMTDEYRRTEVQGGCDACESGSDNPDDWRPLYVPVDPAAVEEADQ